MKKLIIIGAGGHGRVVADCAEHLQRYDDIVFLDDCFAERQMNAHWKIIGKVDDYANYLDADFVVAFGKNALRNSMIKKLTKCGATITTLIHPSAEISKHCTIENGVVIFANAAVNIGSKIAMGCIINTGAIIDHDCNLGECVHISPGANIAGGVSIGDNSWIGIGSSVIQYIELASNIQVGAGAVVTNAEEPNKLYVGIPAKPIKNLDKH